MRDVSTDGGNEDLVLGVQVGRSVELVSCLDYFGGGEGGWVWVFALHAFSGSGDECKEKDTAYLANNQCLGANVLSLPESTSVLSI